jgi:hypothetical protein
MNLVTSAQIGAPKLKVSPPSWVLVLFWAVSIAVLVALSQLAVTDIIVKYVLIGICSLVMLGVLRNQLKGNFLVTIQANKDGLYFQTSDTNQYFCVPWKNVGLIEKAIFPLNSRGLRIEVTGELVEQIKNSKKIGNVKAENGHTFIYSIPQLRNRDRLIEQFESFKMGFPQ